MLKNRLDDTSSLGYTLKTKELLKKERERENSVGGYCGCGILRLLGLNK